MTKRDFTKKAVKLVVQFGTGIIVRAIINNNTDEYDLNAPQQAAVVVASFAIGGAVADAAGTYTDKLIDELVDAHLETKMYAQQ